MNSTTLPLRTGLPGRLAGPSWRVSHRIVPMLTEWYQRWQSRRALAALDDRLLRDIGLDRVAAEREALKPFWEH